MPLPLHTVKGEQIISPTFLRVLLEEGVLPYINCKGFCGTKGMVFELFWSEIGYRVL